MKCVSCGNPSGEGLLCADCAGQDVEGDFPRYVLIGDTIFTETRKSSAVRFSIGPRVGGSVGFEALPNLDEELEIVEEELDVGKEPGLLIPRLERIMLHLGIPEKLDVDSELMVTKEGIRGAGKVLALSRKLRKDPKAGFSPRMETFLGNTVWLSSPLAMGKKALDQKIRIEASKSLSESVLEYYGRALAEDGAYLPALRNRAVIFHLAGRERDCIDACKDYLDRETKDAEIWCLRGAALKSIGENEDALRSYDNALRLSPKDNKLWTQKGLALIGLGKFQEALMCFEQSIRLQPHNPDAYYGKGDALTKLGRIDTAVEAYDIAKGFVPRPAFIKRQAQEIKPVTTPKPLLKPIEEEPAEGPKDEPEPQGLPEERQMPAHKPEVPVIAPPMIDEKPGVEEKALENELEKEIEADLAPEQPKTDAKGQHKSLAEAFASFQSQVSKSREEDALPEEVEIPSRVEGEEPVMPPALLGLGRKEPVRETPPKEAEVEKEASKITAEIGVEQLKAEEEIEEVLLPEPESPKVGEIKKQSLAVTPVSVEADRPAEKPSKPRMSKEMTAIKKLVEDGYEDEALLSLEAVLKLEPENTDALSLKGKILLSLGRSVEALKLLDRVIENDPENVSAVIGKGYALYDANKFETALAVFDQAIFLDKEDIEGWLGKGKTLLEMNKFEDAMVCFNEVIEKDENNLEAWLGIGDCFSGLGRVDEAYKCYEKVNELEPEEAEAWAKKGDVLAIKGRWGAALQFYDRAISLDDEYDYPYVKKGEVLLSRERFEQAGQAFDAALAISPTDSDALCGRAEILIKKGKWGAALQILANVLRQNPNHIKGLTLRGDAYRMDGHIEDARNSYDKVLIKDSKNVNAIMGKSLLLMKHGGFNEAATMLRSALDLQPDNPVIWRHLGTSQKEIGKESEALRSLQKSVELGQHIAENWLALGLMQHELGRYTDAITSFNKTLKLNPRLDEANKWKQQSLKRLEKGG